MTTLTPTRRSSELRTLIQRNRADLDAVFRSYGATDPRLFGSVARGDADDDSDIDFLFTRPAGMGLFALAAMGQELSDLLGVAVDVVPDSGLYEHLRSGVLADAVPI
ncbi:nucleotidyltransferase domain-containing protein [Propionimicrobium sp. PCR01-08-3]|uniref:nucleotidyltransferase family protein n=1 Tax=Propionimicrobium sp. PCR01-08-3 TaxID=3052086 RepID=UPI00255CF828|nr:nucleotidyltransferase domain-containing protein [Propionimicrobium sp. PCR01-08-3]WIY82622.1 nucleotidyltransferase domain-containing protein [Propionimicrobium sp. PCR01-08-3]